MTHCASHFIDSLRRFMSARRYSFRTIKTYLYWIKYFIHYHNSTFSSQDVQKYSKEVALKVAAIANVTSTPFSLVP